MAGDLAGVGRYLNELLGQDPYRQRWLLHAERVRVGRVNAGAVSEVIATYLWDSGLRSEEDIELPRQLKDRVSRALRGEVLSSETLSWFVHSFHFDEDEETELWRLFGESMIQVDADDYLTFNQAHDVLTRARPGDRAELYCLVMERRSGGSAVTFWDVTDGTTTSHVQVGAQRDEFNDDEWSEIRSIRKGARLRISGVLGVSGNGTPTAWLDSFPMIQDYSFPETLDAIEPHRQRIGASLFMASFRNEAERALTDLGYVQLDVRLLANDWHGVEGPYTLRALYTGFGEPMYLAPSPSPQLVEALIATGRDKVFTSTSLFTSSYRDRQDGSEASVIMAKTLNVSLDELLVDARGLLARVIAGMGVGEDLASPLEWPISRKPWPTRFPIDAVDGARIDIYADPADGSSTSVELARLLFPAGFAPVEVAVESRGQGVPLGTMTLYVERLLPLVQHLPIRRLHSIQPLFDTAMSSEDR